MMKRSLGAAAAAVAFVACIGCAGVSAAQDDPTRRDEFGLKPDDGSDRDLSLPDPVLDRSWPVPGPGDTPPAVAPDEDEIDPFKDETAPPPPVKSLPPPPEEPMKRPPPPPAIGPDGKLDAGSPTPEPDPILGDILEPEIDEPSEIDREDAAPSPLDRGDTEFRNETNDPGEW